MYSLCLAAMKNGMRQFVYCVNSRQLVNHVMKMSSNVEINDKPSKYNSFATNNNYRSVVVGAFFSIKAEMFVGEKNNYVSVISVGQH